MGIESVSRIGGDVVSSLVDRVSTEHAGPGFLRFVGQGLDQVDTKLQIADAQLKRLAAGENVSTHDVMIAMEEARMGLMMLSEVRNRVVEAYQELSRMQL